MPKREFFFAHKTTTTAEWNGVQSTTLQRLYTSKRMKNHGEIVCHVHHTIMLMGTPFTLHVQVAVARKHSFDGAAEQVNKFNLFTHFSLTMSLIKVCVCEDWATRRDSCHSIAYKTETYFCRFICMLRVA